MGAQPSSREWQALFAGPDVALVMALRDAAEAGDANAMVQLGQCLLDGRGAARDAPVAFGWFHRAARAGLIDAVNMVGRCLDQGWGVPEMPEQAAAWFAVAAARGHAWGQYNLATALALGRGVTMDRVRALDLFHAVATGATEPLVGAKAAGMIGLFHEEGWTVLRCRDTAMAYHARAARGGDFRGCFNWARLLAESGHITGARYWLGRARALAERDGNARFVAQMDGWLRDRPGLSGFDLSDNDSQ